MDTKIVTAPKMSYSQMLQVVKNCEGHEFRWTEYHNGKPAENVATVRRGRLIHTIRNAFVSEYREYELMENNVLVREFENEGRTFVTYHHLPIDESIEESK